MAPKQELPNEESGSGREADMPLPLSELFDYPDGFTYHSVGVTLPANPIIVGALGFSIKHAGPTGASERFSPRYGSRLVSENREAAIIAMRKFWSVILGQSKADPAQFEDQEKLVPLGNEFFNHVRTRPHFVERGHILGALALLEPEVSGNLYIPSVATPATLETDIRDFVESMRIKTQPVYRKNQTYPSDELTESTMHALGEMAGEKTVLPKVIVAGIGSIVRLNRPDEIWGEPMQTFEQYLHPVPEISQPGIENKDTSEVLQAA